MLRKIFGFAIFVLIVAAAGFFAIGGMQMVRLIVFGPRLPVAASQATPSTDLLYLRQAVLDNERGATPQAVSRFKAIIDTTPPPLSPDDLSLVASEAEAALGNAHSTLMSPLMRRVPIRVHWLADGLIVIKTDPQHAALLGRKLVAIGGRAPEDLVAAMPKLVGGGTPAWARYRSEYFLTAPVALRALGAHVEGDRVMLDTLTPGGSRASVELAADATPVEGSVFGEWRQSLPGDTHYGTQGWQTLLSATQSLPLYQQDLDRSLWLRDLPDRDALYVRIDGSLDAEHETATTFTTRVLAAMKTGRRRNVILDLRYDWGGDYTLFLGLVKHVPEALPPSGHIYLITGPNTFSAGLITATQIKYFAKNRVTVVGGDVGDVLRFRSEGFVIELPVTKIDVYVPSAWDDVGKDCGLFDDCWPPNKFYLHGIGSLAPDIRAANDWASYRGGRDAVVDAIFGDIAKRNAGSR